MHSGRIVFIGLFLVAGFARAAEFEFEYITPFRGRETSATSINNRGEAVLTGGYTGEDTYVRSKFGVMTLITAPAGEPIWALGSNDRGTVVGFVWDIPNNRTLGFIQTKQGDFITDVLPACCSSFDAINNAGYIIGSGPNGPFSRSPEGAYQYVLYKGLPGMLFDINNAGDVTGWNSQETFVRKADGTFVPMAVPGATETMAWGLNDRGTVVGYYRTERVHGFILRPNGEFLMVDVPDAWSTVLRGVTNDDEVIGDAVRGATRTSFIARPTKHFRR